MEKPNIEKYTYSTGELKSPVEYIEALELYLNHLEAENKQLTIQRVRVWLVAFFDTISTDEFELDNTETIVDRFLSGN
mgnify:CR=1 FL=1